MADLEQSIQRNETQRDKEAVVEAAVLLST